MELQTSFSLCEHNVWVDLEGIHYLYGSAARAERPGLRIHQAVTDAYQHTTAQRVTVVTLVSGRRMGKSPYLVAIVDNGKDRRTLARLEQRCSQGWRLIQGPAAGVEDKPQSSDEYGMVVTFAGAK